MAERTLVTEASMDDVRPGYDSGLAASTAPHRILRTLHYAYPIVLLLFFLCAFTLQSIRASSKRNSNGNGAPDQQLGPGGKPLPNLDPTRNAPKKPKHDDISRPRKLVFEWMSVVLALTFIGNTINVIVHALYDREEQWWCGQAMVVCESTAGLAHVPLCESYLGHLLI